MRPIGRVALLVALWLLAWGEISLANVLSGVAVAGGAARRLPARPRATGAAPRPPRSALARLAGYVAGAARDARTSLMTRADPPPAPRRRSPACSPTGCGTRPRRSSRS